MKKIKRLLMACLLSGWIILGIGLLITIITAIEKFIGIPPAITTMFLFIASVIYMYPHKKD